MKKKFKTILKVAAGLLAGMALGFGLGIGMAVLLEDSGYPLWQEMALFLLAALAAYFIQTVVHEGGHLVCGLLSGYTFLSFRVGSVMLVKQDGKLVRKKFNLPGTGGQCLLMPPEGDAPQLLYNLGGGLANLALSALAGLLLLLPSPFPVRVLLVMLLVWGVFMAVTNLIPLRMAGIVNDGYNARALGRDPVGRQAFLTQLRVNGMIARGVPLKDMPAEWFELPPGADRSSPLICATDYLAACRLLDQGDLHGAQAAIRDLLGGQNGMLGLHRSELECEALYCELLGENRPQERERIYTKELQKYVAATRKYMPGRYRLLYALALLADGDEEKAEEYRAAFEKGAASYPYPVEMEGERRLMELARLRAEQLKT